MEGFMEKIKSNQVAQYIKSTILKYAPLVDSREELFDTGNSVVEAQITVAEDESCIIFLNGTVNDLSATDDFVKTEKSIAFDEIKNVIDFLLEDHRYISDIDLFGPFDCENTITLKFPINWTEKSIKRGINCRIILLNLIFDDERLMKQYISMLFKQYNEELSKTPTIKRINGNCIGSEKYYWIQQASKPEILELLSKLSDEELKRLMRELDNDTFTKYISSGDLGKGSYTFKIPPIR